MTDIFIDDKILQITKKEIERDVGSLSDLPVELANTIANYYYQSNELASGIAESRALQNKDLRKGLISYTYEAETILNFITTIPELVNGLRKINRLTQPRLYYYMTNFALDVLKYGIPNAANKSHVRRQLERLFRKKRLREIPNLIIYIQESNI